MSRLFKPWLVILYAAVTVGISCSDQQSKFPQSHSTQLLENWVLIGPDSLGELSATVPGVVHLDLMQAGVIPDPFKDNNALELEWIEQSDWTYRCYFELADSLLTRDAVSLVFEGIDTYASVWLNGNRVLEANNMFRPWRFNAKPFIKTGKNELEVKLRSPVKAHQHSADSLGFAYPSDNDPSHTAPFVRKAAYHFGWDWAPRIVTCGIWKLVYLEYYDVAHIADIHIKQQSLNDSIAKLDVDVTLEMVSDEAIEVYIQGQLAELSENTAIAQIEIEQPTLWWPNGSGKQHLYPVRIEIKSNGRIIDSQEQMIGLRTVELINKPDSIGTSFYFKINGEPVFMKGANYVPQDVFLTRVRPSQYRALLIAAKEANMNMLRVWGGGIYENELFYDLCDSLGLLVWQDFMFAGTMYPGDEAFLSNVKAEAVQQVCRLRHHPCLALWCGNNEINVAWHNWGWQEKYGYLKTDSAKMWRDYIMLFEQVLPEIVKENSPETDYVATTPQSNWGTASNFDHGSMHYWGVWHGRESASSYRENVGRFMVEYGMQSYPEVNTLEHYIFPGQRHLESPIMKARQKSYIGNGEIERHIKEIGLKPQNFSEFIMASQKAQAHALEIAIEAHLESNGHCMGSLVWQLNDCWPGPSWSLIDYSGRKKLGYYTVQKGFNPE